MPRDLFAPEDTQTQTGPRDLFAGTQPETAGVSRETPDPTAPIKADIAAKLAAGRITPEAARNVTRYMDPNQPGRVANIMQGATLGAADELGGGIAAANAALGGRPGSPGDAYAQERDTIRQQGSDYAKANPVSAGALQAMGGLPLSMLPLPKAIPGSNLLANMGNGALTAGGLGAAYGFNSGQGGALPRLQNAAEVGIPSAAIGAAVPAVMEGGRQIARGIRQAYMPPTTAAPEVSALAQKAQDLGVPIRPGQMSQSKFVRSIDDQLANMPGTGYGEANPLRISPEAQHEAFTRAVSKTFGEDATRLTQDVLASANKRISDTYETVLARNNVTLDDHLVEKLGSLEAAAKDALDEDAKPVLNTITKIMDRAKDGEITGRQYQTMRARGGALSRLTDNNDPTVAYYGRQIKAAVDDAFQRQAVGEDGQIMAQARSQLRNLKVVEPLAAKAPTGAISPALLLEQVRNEFPDFASRGAGDLGELARIGQQFIKAPPDSGTASRSAVMGFLSNPITSMGKAAAIPLQATIGRAVNSSINSPSALAALMGRGPNVVPGSPQNLSDSGIIGLAAQYPALWDQIFGRAKVQAINERPR